MTLFAVNPISSQQQLLADVLDAHGWSIVDRQTNFADWLYFEVWKIESVWRPVGKTAFMTFLNDPMPSNGPRRPNAVACSRTSPVEGDGAHDSFAWVGMTHWKYDLVELLDKLEDFRNSET